MTACPPTNSTPCATDAECHADQRCRRGACGPICLDDTECGSGQTCQAGVCAVRPECAADTDCAAGFTCTNGTCTCTGDAACSANQVCTNGVCQTRPRCTADADCLGSGGRCEVTQGVCLPVCVMPQDCAPNLDPNVAFALYTCVQGTCTRRCTTDVLCGGSGFICQNGLCTVAQCKAASDCPQGQYCTSATFGRCQSFQTCTSSSQCMANFECKRFPTGQCPPGFDCTQQVCLELPTCLSDGDCVSGVPGSPTSMPTGYCAEGHCQQTGTCTVSLECPTGQECIGALCVPSVCRGNAACGAGQACVGGACATPPAGGDITLASLRPAQAVMLVGDTLPFTFIGSSIDGSTFPMGSASYQVLDALGATSTAATITAAGVLTAVTPGQVTVRALVPGSVIAPVSSTVTIYPRITAGRRVLVLAQATGLPIANVHVQACTPTCTEVVTGADGVALFPSLAPTDPATFTAAAEAVRTDGLPAWERASIIGTTSSDVVLPLRDNPVQGLGGFNASISFTDVSTIGSYWAGFVTASTSDLPSVTPTSLVGDSFNTPLPGIMQSVPVPSTVVLYTSPAFGIPQQVKARSLGGAQSGARATMCWAGRANLNITTSLRSTDLLSYLGAFDYAQGQASFSSRPWVDDTADVNGNGLCSDPMKCPNGSEKVPDYVNFTPLTFQPRRQQVERTEVVFPRVPSTFNTVVVAVVAIDRWLGVLPVGFSSATAGAAGADGTRKVPNVTLRSGSPYAGLEASSPGVWVLAANTAGTAYSGRLTSSAVLPTSVQVAPLLPAPTGGSFSLANRAFNPGQPAWSSVYSSGGELARVSLTGTEVRHTIYFALGPNQTQVGWPTTPAGVPGQDPAAESGSTLEVVAVDLANGTTVEGVFDAAGQTLVSWSQSIDGYARADR